MFNSTSDFSNVALVNLLRDIFFARQKHKGIKPLNAHQISTAGFDKFKFAEASLVFAHCRSCGKPQLIEEDWLG